MSVTFKCNVGLLHATELCPVLSRLIMTVDKRTHRLVCVFVIIITSNAGD